jgi:hypothetical protein
MTTARTELTIEFTNAGQTVHEARFKYNPDSQDRNVRLYNNVAAEKAILELVVSVEQNGRRLDFDQARIKHGISDKKITLTPAELAEALSCSDTTRNLFRNLPLIQKDKVEIPADAREMAKAFRID